MQPTYGSVTIHSASPQAVVELGSEVSSQVSGASGGTSHVVLRRATSSSGNKLS